MPEKFEIRLVIVLFIALAILPFTLRLLLRGRRSFFRRVLTMLNGLVLGGVCACLILLLLLHVGVLELEWRGGYVPIPTWNKTHTDYAALESSRKEQAKQTTSEVHTNQITANWPGFRGPNQNGEYTEKPILTDWPTNGLHLLWKQACGGGYSSFAIKDDRAFTLEQRHDNEVVVAYDFLTGRELWTNGWPALFSEYHSDAGPRSTPAYDDGKIYVLGATGEFRCLNATNGAIIWSTNIVTQNNAQLPDYGLAASPLVVGDKVILQPDVYHGKSVVCYDKHDGKILWGALDLPMGYATPLLVSLGGEQQVLVCGRPPDNDPTTGIIGLRVDDGKERWHYHWHIINNERPITQPLMIGTNQFMVSAVYMTGCAAFEVDCTNSQFQVNELWKTKALKAKFASGVYYQGYIYGLDEDILACVDAKTGERKWKDGRYGYGQVLLASGHLVVLCADGRLALVKATPDALTEVAVFPALNGKTWNAPAIGGGRLLLRNGAEMACYQISPP